MCFCRIERCTTQTGGTAAIFPRPVTTAATSWFCRTRTLAGRTDWRLISAVSGGYVILLRLFLNWFKEVGTFPVMIIIHALARCCVLALAPLGNALSTSAFCVCPRTANNMSVRRPWQERAMPPVSPPNKVLFFIEELDHV